MRVLIVAEVYLPKIDGVVVRLLKLIDHLRAQGDEVFIVHPEAPGDPDEGDVPAFACKSFPHVLYPEYFVGIPSADMAAAVREFDPDVIHVMNPFAFGFRCYDSLLHYGIDKPTVGSFHTLYAEYVKDYPAVGVMSNSLWWTIRQYHNRFALNLAVSPTICDELIERGFERVRLWPPAVDAERFHPDKASASMRSRLMGKASAKHLLLTVSRLAPEKNIGMLAKLLDEIPDACLAIVGDGPARPELERTFAGRQANFVGYLQGDELASAYASADAFVFASKTETLGLVVLEAMASGCPVVAPRAGGPQSLVDSGVTGMLYPPDDVAEAARQTRQLLSDAALRTSIDTHARESVVSRSWHGSGEAVRAAYREAIERPRSRESRTWSQFAAKAYADQTVAMFRLIARIAPPASSV